MAFYVNHKNLFVCFMWVYITFHFRQTFSQIAIMSGVAGSSMLTLECCLSGISDPET